MSVEPSQAISEIWSRWQGHAINDRFVLGHYLGCSDHSGVFLTESVAHPSLRLAVKLVPTTRAIAQARLPVCKQVKALAHPHLLGLFESGVCQLDGSPHLYVVMERADQTLAQVLQRRVLSDGEAQEMLVPILDALAFLHRQNLVQGQLKPSNILVVGDQLKLASDTIRRVGKITVGTSPLSQYDPPEARHGGDTAADVWALGVSLSDALARRSASSSGSRKLVELPSDFSPGFREVVARCLSATPQNRPSVAELTAWAVERKVAAAPGAINMPTAPVPKVGKSDPAPPVAESLQLAYGSEPHSAVVTPPLKPRVLLVAVFATLFLALGWTAVHGLVGHGAPAPVASMPVVTQVSMPSVAPVPAVAPVALHEVIPDAPQSVLKSIHAPVSIGVRVMVEQDGSVFAALEDRSNASKRLQRLAIDAAKEWMFPPSDAPARRLMQIRFDFSSDGTTASARSLD